MKKLILVLIFFFVQNVAQAAYLPNYMNSVSNWGMGAVLAPREFSLHKSPDLNSEKILNIKWAQDGELFCNGEECKENPFVAFVPNKNYAILAAYDEYNGWAEVYYGNNQEKLFLKLNDSTRFYTWGQFMLAFGKKHGLYAFKDVKKEDRVLYGSPVEGGQIVDSFELAKFITPWFVRGNWVMVKLIHWDNTQKTGFLRWRDLDGRLWVFVRLND